MVRQDFSLTNHAGFQTMTRILLVLVLLLSACTPRAHLVVDPQAAGVGTVQPVFFGTNRTPDGLGRSEQVHYGRIDVSVPPDRAPGSITFPDQGERPDPTRHFLVTSQLGFAHSQQFQSALNSALRHRPASERSVVLFVHGYNSTFAEGLYRFAQLSHDLKYPGLDVHFSWPSRGQPLAYAADRDSVLFSRDGLEETIRAVTGSQARSVIIMGHSMGASLVMETLRQLALKGDRATLDRIEGVILMSPDLDVDVFRMQAKAIGKLPKPFLIFTSSQDRALRLSARLSAEPVRLGTLGDPHRLSDLEVTLVDVGAFNTGDGHFNAATSPALMGILSRVSDFGRAFAADGGQVGLFTGAALTVERAVQIVLVPGQGLTPDFLR